MSRVLIVEDEMLISMLLEDMLIELGHDVAYSAQRLDQAVSIARTAVIDIAVLDINLNGSESYPVADILRERDIPFIFTSGYGAAGLNPNYRGATVIAKPFVDTLLGSAIRSLAKV